MTLRLMLHALLLVQLAACSSIITYDSIAESGAPAEIRGRALGLLGSAIEQANGFLSSQQRISLPRGHYQEAEDGTLLFVTDARRWPIRIRHSFGGDLVVWFGFRAQERDDGFVVGSRPPDEHAEIDNSMFRTSDGDWQSAHSIARLILHETAHTVHRHGTVGYWNTLAYYTEAIFLFRAANHSAERTPRAISVEFEYHRLIRAAEDSGDQDAAEVYRKAFAEHLALGRENCVHELPAE